MNLQLIYNTSSPVIRDAGAGSSEWKSFSLDPAVPTNISYEIGGRLGFYAFEGDKDSKYDVDLKLNITVLPDYFIGTSKPTLIVAVQEDADMIDKMVIVDIKEYTEVGDYTIKLEDIVNVVIYVNYYNFFSESLTGYYKADDKKTSGDELFSIDDIILLGTIAGSFLSIGAILFGSIKIVQRMRFRKLVDKYLMNKEITLRELVGDDEKKILKLKKHLIDRGILRDEDM
ncbi:MAG: hypothetical protein ACFFCQ_05565 [Promethearchaeota archaeon]